MPITKCTTHDKDENAIYDKYIVSVAKTLAQYFLCSYYTMFSLFFGLKPSFKKLNQSGHLFCYLFCDCVEQILNAGADMNTMDDNNR